MDSLLMLFSSSFYICSSFVYNWWEIQNMQRRDFYKSNTQEEELKCSQEV